MALCQAKQTQQKPRHEALPITEPAHNIYHCGIDICNNNTLIDRNSTDILLKLL